MSFYIWDKSKTNMQSTDVIDALSTDGFANKSIISSSAFNCILRQSTVITIGLINALGIDDTNLSFLSDVNDITSVFSNVFTKFVKKPNTEELVALSTSNTGYTPMSNNVAANSIVLRDASGAFEVNEAIKPNQPVQLQQLEAVAKANFIEYGVRFLTSSSSPTGERVIRNNGVISVWDIEFDRYDNPFDDLELFSPELITTEYGAFRRFKQFYVSFETFGGYDYIFVSKIKRNDNYRLPFAFEKQDGTHWQYVDIAVYEASLENNKLVSKPEAFIESASDIQYATLQQYIPNGYQITELSEITEILQPLITIMLGTKNSQDSASTANQYSCSRAGVSYVFPARCHNLAISTITGTTIYTNYSDINIRMSVGSEVRFTTFNNATLADIADAKDTRRRVTSVTTNSFTIDKPIATTFKYCHMYRMTTDATEVNGRRRLTEFYDLSNVNLTIGNVALHACFMQSFKLLGIENIWGNSWKIIPDFYTDNDGNYFYNRHGKVYSIAQLTATGFVSNFAEYIDTASQTKFPELLLPSAMNGSSTTYYCDGIQMNNVAALQKHDDDISRVIRYGGDTGTVFNAGLYALYYSYQKTQGNAAYRLSRRSDE